MLRWFGALVVVLSAFSVGVLKYEELKRRELELNDFLRFLDHIESIFDCLHGGLPEALEGAIVYCETDFQLLLSSVLKQLRSASGVRASKAWEIALQETKLAINTEDFDVLRDFGKGLDGSDFSAQQRNIAFAKKQTERRLEDARESRKVNGKLAVQLSVFGSVATVLLLL